MTDSQRKAREIAEEFFAAVRAGDTLENVTVSEAVAAALEAARAEALEEAAKVPLNPEIVGRTEMARAIRALSSEAPAAREEDRKNG